MSRPFISICIPVYNMEPYLRECLDSLLSQSFKDWEAVCTDDGATDGSGAILDEYVQKDARIKVIHQKNGGLCNARNSAWDRATGEWLWFVDADDALLDGALDWFWKCAHDAPYDGFCCTGCTPFENHCDAAVSGSGKIVASIDVPDIGKRLYFQEKPLRGLPFNRIVRRERFSKVRFIDGLKYLEDSIQLIEMLSLKARWAFVDIKLYGYRNRTDSISHGYKRGKCALELASFELMFAKAKGGLELTPRENRAFIGQYRGSLTYYLHQGFHGEDEAGLNDMLQAYQSLCKSVGFSPVNVFYRMRFHALRAGIFHGMEPLIRLCEYVYFGVRSHLGMKEE